MNTNVKLKMESKIFFSNLIVLNCLYSLSITVAAIIATGRVIHITIKSILVNGLLKYGSIIKLKAKNEQNKTD